MRRFIRKKLRTLSKVKIKPKKLAIISVFAMTIFATAMLRVFATADVSFELVPDRTTYDRETNYEVTLDLKFDTDKEWDKIGITILADPNVFEDVSFNITNSGFTNYDGTALTRSEKSALSSDFLNIIGTGDAETGRYTTSINFTKGGSFSKGLYLGTVTMNVKENARSGETNIAFELEKEGEKTTYLQLGDDPWEIETHDATVFIEVPLESHSVTPNSLTLDINENPTGNIIVNYEPVDTTEDKTFTFISNAEEIATVDGNGVVTAVAPGSTFITVTEFGTTTQIPVTVTAKLRSISLDQSLVELAKDQTKTFTVTTDPSPTTDNVTYNWTSSDSSKVSVNSSGVITALSGGEGITITATAVVNGTVTTIKAQATVNVVVPFTSASANPNSIHLKRGVTGEETATINVVYEPSDATQTKSVTWESLDTTIATVDDDGVVTAVAAGTTRIKGTVANVAPFYVDVTVDVPMQSFTVEPTEINIYTGQTQTITPAITPNDTNETKTINWTTGAAGVATVSNGVITAVAPGTTTITAQTGNNGAFEATVLVHVYDAITSVQMSEASATLYTNDGEANKKKNLSVTVNPAGAGTVEDNEITWSSGNENVATVNQNGQVTAVANGTTTITATLGNGSTATCEITVKTKVTSFTVTSANPVTIEKGSTHTITTSIQPTTASDKEITWDTADPAKATVNSQGVVTAVDKGTVNITGTLPDGKQVVVQVIVKISANSVTITEGDTYSINKSQTATLHATIDPQESTDTVRWSSSDSSKVEVNETTGVITAKARGTATITATAGTKTDTITVNVVVPATSVTISDGNSLTINQGNTKTLTAVTTPDDCTETVTWTSSDDSKVSVNASGKITAVATGNATITATAGEYSDSIEITVILAATGIEINEGTSARIEKGQTKQLTTTITPAGSTDATVNWTSTNENVATVSSSGLVTAVGKGTATIKAEVGSVSDTISVNVVISATNVTIAGNETITVNKGSTTNLSATVTPNDSSDTVTWESSNTSVATVSSTGVVTAKAKGTATIKAKAGTKEDTVTVNVVIPATSVTIAGEENITMNKNTTKQLSATVAPSDTSDTTITWTSSNPSIASVSSTGLVTANATGGPVTITAKAGTKTDTVTINVVLPATSVTISGAETITLHRGNSTTLTATVLPNGSTDNPATWTSSDSTVASVDSNGVVSAHKIGTATITATAGTKTDTVKIKVDAPITSFTTNNDDISIIKGKTQTLTYTIEPTDTTDDTEVSWESDDTSKVTVDEEGKITAISAGVAHVTATVGGRTITYTVTVGIIPINSISLNKNDFELRKGDTEPLTVIVDPENSTEITDPEWSSSDTSVATVDEEGNVKGIAAGTATITATMDGKTAEVTVTVIEIPLTSISISNTTDNVAIGDTLTIQIQENPTNTTEEVEYTFETSDSEIATVDSQGNVKGLKNGTVTITVKSSNGLEDTIQLNIVTPQNIINPNTGVKSVIIYIISGICSLVGAGFIIRKKAKAR